MKANRDMPHSKKATHCDSISMTLWEKEVEKNYHKLHMRKEVVIRKKYQPQRVNFRDRVEIVSWYDEKSWESEICEWGDLAYATKPQQRASTIKQNKKKNLYFTQYFWYCNMQFLVLKLL